MAAEQSKELTRRWYMAASEGNMDVVDELIADHFINHNPTPGFPEDKAGVHQWVQMMRSAFPDFRFDIEDMAMEGNIVWTRMTVSGTHRGEFMGMPPTGKHFEITAIDIVRVEQNKAVERWGLADQMSMMQQLGMMQPSGTQAS